MCRVKLGQSALTLNNSHFGLKSKTMQALMLGMLFFAAFGASLSSASAETRSLKLYFTHTGERADIVFKRNGRYDTSGLNKINRFLRDWRRNEPTKMDPKLMDLLWEVYRQSGSRKEIHVISAYRSPATNAMLKRTRGGQATKSQHMVGKAIDFFLPDVKVSKVRAIALKLGAGGVGYYPKSGSPFVHIDTGSVRHWPRMSRGELVSVFPNGGTLHVPTDGKPLPGYDKALASYKSRQASGNLVASSGGNSSSSSNGKKPTLLGMLFGGGADEEEDTAETVAVASAPARAAPAAPAAQQAEIQVAALPVESLPELPTRNAPIPTPAPRASLNQGIEVPVAAPAIETPEIVPVPIEPALPVESETTLVALNVPLPSPRPDYRPVAPLAPDTSILTARLETINDGSDARNALREALSLPSANRDNQATDTLVTALVPAVPTPSQAPEISTEQALAPSAFPATPDGKSGRISIVPQPRPSLQAVEVARLSVAPSRNVVQPATPIGQNVQTGVQTTQKAPKPQLLQPTNAFDVAPLPSGSTRFGPAGSAKSALRAMPESGKALALSTQNPIKNGNAFAGNAVSFQTTASLGQ